MVLESNFTFIGNLTLKCKFLSQKSLFHFSVWSRFILISQRGLHLLQMVTISLSKRSTSMVNICWIYFTLKVSRRFSILILNLRRFLWKFAFIVKERYVMFYAKYCLSGSIQIVCWKKIHLLRLSTNRPHFVYLHMNCYSQVKWHLLEQLISQATISAKYGRWNRTSQLKIAK